MRSRRRFSPSIRRYSQALFRLMPRPIVRQRLRGFPLAAAAALPYLGIVLVCAYLGAVGIRDRRPQHGSTGTTDGCLSRGLVQGHHNWGLLLLLQPLTR